MADRVDDDGRATAGPPPRVAAAGEDLVQDMALPAGVADPGVVEAVIDLAIEIAREGREGRRIGTIFTVGDHHEVLRRSRCLILDPLAGHPPPARRIGAVDARETIKELAQLDGGFVVSGEGVVESGCRYFESSLSEIEPRLGLGTRHIAAASISRCTSAIAVVVSESAVVRVFVGGRLETEILPELWLLRRYIPHLEHPQLTEHRAENVVVLSATEGDSRARRRPDR